MNTASTVHRAALALGAVIITIPGVRILFDTAGYVEDKDNLTLTPDLYSELRALGAIFVAAGFILVIGVVVAGFRHTATLVGVIAFLPQGIARVISYGANDGQTDSYLRVGVVEMVVGVLLLAFLINDARTARKTAHA